MASAITHARSSAKKWGGRPEDYLAIHEWFDETKAHVGDFRHRALRHHAFGVEECIAHFGQEISVRIDQRRPCSGDGCQLCALGAEAQRDDEGAFHVRIKKKVPTRWVAEQHLIEDFGRIPILADWLRRIEPEAWMVRDARRLSAEVEEATLSAVPEPEDAA